MYHVNRESVEREVVREPGAKQTIHRKMIDTIHGADRYVLTEFEIEPLGSTPPHYHDWEHEIYVVQGSMTLINPQETTSLRVTAGDAIFIPRNEPHGFVTGTDETCRFIVVAPTERPPIRSVFLSDDPYEYTHTAQFQQAQSGGSRHD